MSDLIEGHLAHLRAGGYSEQTIDDRRKILLRLDRELPYGVEQVATEDLEEWLSQFYGWTLYTYRNHIVGFYRWSAAGHRPHLSFDPSADLARKRPPKGVPRPASDDQVRGALQLARPWRTAIVLARYNGLRCGEITRLDREHVTRERMIVRRKGGKLAAMFVHPYVWAEVEELPAGPLVPHPRTGRRWIPDRLSGAMSEQLAGVGLVGVTLHRFRHAFATWMLLPVDLGGAGANLREVQVLMGHESPTSTAIYTEITDGQLRRLMQKLPTVTGSQQVAP